MKQLKKCISLVICAAIIIGLLPQVALAENHADGTCTVESGTIYVLVPELTVNFTVPEISQTQGHANRGQTTQVKVPDLKDQGKYLIVATNGTGTQQAAVRNNNKLSNTQVQVNPADAAVPRQYISDKGNATVWSAIEVDNSANAHDAAREESDWRFSAGNRYLNGNGISNSGSQMSVRNHYLSWNYAKTFLGLSYNNRNGTYSWTSNDSNDEYGPPPAAATQFYFYEETTISSTYSISANDVQLVAGGTMRADDIVRQLKVNGADLTTNLNGTYSYEIVSGGNAVSLENGTLTGTATGAAKLRVSYSWNGNTVWTEIDVVVGVPRYEVEIRDGEISKNIISKKNVQAGDTLQLNALVHAGSLNYPNPTVTWSSTNGNVATVDNTGKITFTGDEGTTVVLATFTYINDEGEEITVIDQVTVTASTDTHIFPSDGTNDFPEYPNEGSVRLDKTGKPLGNFNELGMVEVELSMTGVPFTTNNTLDVVLMLDESNSMTPERLAATIAATKVFLQNLVYNEDGSFTGNRIFVGSFQGGNPEYKNQTQHQFHIHYITQDDEDKYQIITSDTEYESLVKNVEAVLEKDPANQAAYGTEYAESLKFCYELLDSTKSDGHKQFCVFMSDGIPNVYQGETSLLYNTNNNNQINGMFTGTNRNTRGSNYQYERYSSYMKANGVTVFSVALGLSTEGASTENAGNILLNDISGPAGETAANRDTGSTVSKRDEYFFSVADAGAAAQMGNVFDKIAKKIQEAAKDVKVTDQITSDYSMVFDPPTASIAGSVSRNDLFIEIMDYELVPVTQNGTVVDYRRGTGTQKMRLYMGKNSDGSYYAASDASGTRYAAPLFEQKPIGSMYYWTTTNNIGNPGYIGVSVEVGNTTYYFDANGVSDKDANVDLSKWYNMSSGAYAYGTPSTIEGETDAKDATVYRNLIIATPYFVYNAANRKLIWTLDKVSSSEIALRYFLYLEGATTGPEKEPDPGTYPTNVEATLSYTNFQDNKAQQWFPEPQMTWHGAQTSYVFYLVNEQGQPVNRAGRVVPLSEAVYVTDVHTISVVWTGLQEQDTLGAELLAKDIVPSVYQLYDPTAAYTIHAFANETSMLQNNHFKLEGSTNTTYVFNTKSDATKYNQSGVYGAGKRIMCKDYNVTKDGNNWQYHGNPADQCKDQNGAYVYDTDSTGDYTIVYETADRTVEEGFNFYDTTVAFAVKWIPSLAPDVVVIDYGLDVLVDIATNDMGVAEPVGLLAAAPDDVVMNTGVISNFNRANALATLNIMDNDRHVATASMEGNSIRFHLNRANGMQLTQDYNFYYVSSVSYYSNNALVTDYMYTSVRVIPATTMYYEEDFVATSDGWTTDGSMSATAVQDVDRPGFNNISSSNDANNVYGYDSHYRNCPKYSQNAAKIGSIGASAAFTFNGTGFDLIGRTDQKTACILVSITQDGSPVSFTGRFTRNGQIMEATGESIFVDTYYEGAGGVSAIPQVPVITVRGLNYGTYTVSVSVVRTDETNTSFYHPGTDRFYLDAVRIYDPIGTRLYNDRVGAVYVLDNEWNPGYEEFRNEILKVYGNSPFAEPTFIDRVGNTMDISQYNIWGPNNEFYLPAGSSIKMGVDSTYLKSFVSKSSAGIADLQLGIKLVSGSSVSVTISTDTPGSTGYTSRNYTITSTTDLSFSIKDLYAGNLTIKNNGGGIVALTTMKVTLQPPRRTLMMSMRPSPNVGIEEQPGYIENNTNPENSTNPPVEAPATPQGIIAGAILSFKESFAAVIIAVANAMDGFSKWLQNVANALFS